MRKSPCEAGCPVCSGSCAGAPNAMIQVGCPKPPYVVRGSPPGLKRFGLWGADRAGAAAGRPGGLADWAAAKRPCVSSESA
jgi:hypothetical protein